MVGASTQRLCCRGTPWKITFLGFAFLSAAAASVMLIPDESSNLVITRAVTCALLSGGGIATLAGASLVFDLQKS